MIATSALSQYCRVTLVIICSSLIYSATSFSTPNRGIAHRFRTSSLQSQLLVPQHLDLSQQIFCNVELNGENLEAVGFDMDFTLAQVKTCPQFYRGDDLLTFIIDCHDNLNGFLSEKFTRWWERWAMIRYNSHPTMSYNLLPVQRSFWSASFRRSKGEITQRPGISNSSSWFQI